VVAAGTAKFLIAITHHHSRLIAKTLVPQWLILSSLIAITRHSSHERGRKFDPPFISRLRLGSSTLNFDMPGRLESATRDGGRGMARISKDLNPRELSSLGEGEHCDGGGLYLRVTGMGGRSWIVKYQWAKKQEKMGIGSLADVGLAAARKKAKTIREQARDGINPKLQREQVFGVGAVGAPVQRLRNHDLRPSRHRPERRKEQGQVAALRRRLFGRTCTNSRLIRSASTTSSIR
jgi:hypothetical protein